ncbi:MULTISPECIES: glycosyltransferase family 4 protein [unclassified Aminobacter]|uniref:glycosyltransferase family 4 protein n=1 Tax=unclassified Aminobacter TaxID=2644704 RepID=UPI000467D42A|nr:MULTISPECIES: glycosyltransferase family 4 protein [unclassified Aminobacter]TWH28753.1 glycosyltransferase involved in cell wall biosynthesis [Aminobacter sp. J15]
MKVLYAYRYGIIGGVSTQLLLRQKALREAGIRCDLFFSQDNGLGQVLPNQDGIYFGTERSFRQLVRNGRFDAVIVVDTPELFNIAHGPFYRRTRVFLDVHTTTATGLSYLATTNPSTLSGVMVPTQYSATLVAERLQASPQVSVVPNILDIEIFTPSSVAPQIAKDGICKQRNYVWVGKLDLHKNWRLALIYTAMLQRLSGDHITLDIVGGYTATPNQSSAFFQLIHRLGISERVNWLDRIENSSLVELYRRCADSGGAMLVTSRDESFGMAAAEALLCGCPVIANDLPVFREVLPNSPLVQLVDIWRPEQVERAARTLSTPPAATEVNALHRSLSQRFGAHAFVDSFTAMVGRFG